VSELYAGRQFVGMDLDRRRSVLVRMTESGEHLETVRGYGRARAEPVRVTAEPSADVRRGAVGRSRGLARAAG